MHELSVVSQDRSSSGGFYELETSTASSGLDRALKVIYAVANASSDGLGVSVIARQVGLSKAVAHRILKVLSADGFLAIDASTKRYVLGGGARAVGLAALRQLDLQRVAHPILERLVAVTGETATLSIRQGFSRMYIDQVLSPQNVRMSVTVGHVYSLHAGASSKALLAALDDAEVQAYLATHTLDHVTAATITSREKLLAEVAVIRQRGYAASSGERDASAASVAAAVRGDQGRVLGAVSVCGPLTRFEHAELARYGDLTIAAAADAAAAAGYAPRT